MRELGHALALADPDIDKTELFREAIRTDIRVRAGKQLAALGGAAPQMTRIPRRRTISATERDPIPLGRCLGVGKPFLS